MTDITEQSVLDALRQVEDPSQGKDIVALGMIAGLVIKQSNISFALEVPAHRGPAMEPVRRAAEAAV
ncbi:MAG: iron-sulfur cluster assembly protein, partial [Candidatus Puniceispirillum sp.]